MDPHTNSAEPIGTVALKYRGTRDDEKCMKRSGRLQDTQRRYGSLTMLDFGSTLIATVEVIFTSFQLGILNGGTAGMFWAFMVVTGGLGLVYASLAELMSMQPTAGGQYEWTSMFAPRAIRRYLSFENGWLCVIGWQSAITGIAMLAAGAIQGLIALTHQEYSWARWHGSLLTIAIVFFASAVNIFAANLVPNIEGIVVVVRIIGILADLIVLWVLAPKNNSYDAFLQFRNDSGWHSIAMAVMSALQYQVVSLLGFDSLTHMSEETTNAARTAPRSTMWSFCLNAVLGLLGVITLMFTCGDLEELSHTPYGLPIISMYYEATGSKVATMVIVSLLIIPLFASVVAVVATASRQARAFARDGGLPCSRFLDRIHHNAAVPVNAIMLSFLGCVILSIVNVASATALAAILALNLCCLLGSYAISIGCLLFKRVRGGALPQRQWSLGRWGLYINIAALLWLLPIFVFAMLPSSVPVEVDTLNWGGPMLGFVFVFSTGYYVLKGKDTYISPVERQRDGECGTPSIKMAR